MPPSLALESAPASMRAFVCAHTISSVPSAISEAGTCLGSCCTCVGMPSACARSANRSSAAGVTTCSTCTSSTASLSSTAAPKNREPTKVILRGTATPLDGSINESATTTATARRAGAAREQTARPSLRPRVLQARDAIEHRLGAGVVDAVGHEVAVALELEALVGAGTAQRRLDPGLRHRQAV